jgi:hypothetical protein
LLAAVVVVDLPKLLPLVVAVQAGTEHHLVRPYRLESPIR